MGLCMQDEAAGLCLLTRGARDVWQLARAGALGEGHGRNLGIDSKDSGEPLRSLELGLPPHFTPGPSCFHLFFKPRAGAS